MDLDKSLDSILADKPRSRKPRPTGPKATNGIKKQTAKVTKPSGQTQRKAALPVTKIPEVASKIIVHGLPTDVTEKQIKEYLAAEVGPVHRCELNYTAQGKSKGTATITFTRGGRENYAQKACTLLNGRSVDQSGPKPTKMRVEIVTEVKAPGLGDRLGSLPKAVVEAVKKSAGNKSGGKKLKKTGPGRVKKVPKTAAELDAEMTDYFDKKSA